MNNLTFENRKTEKYKWQFKEFPHYKVTENRTIVNTKTGRKVKYVVNGYSKGVWIGKRFITNLNNHVEKIESIYCPF